MVCEPLKAPEYGMLTGTDVSYGSVIVASCFEGFMQPDHSLSQSIQCLAVGSPQPVAVWSQNVTDCQRA